MKNNKKTLKDIFKEETSENLLNEIIGGSGESSLACAMLWLSCQQDQILPCGTTPTSCEIWRKNCK